MWLACGVASDAYRGRSVFAVSGRTLLRNLYAPCPRDIRIPLERVRYVSGTLCTACARAWKHRSQRW